MNSRISRSRKEHREVYERNYLEQKSKIVSTKADRPIIRPSGLVFFRTTSLYGIGSSQYNRLPMPASRCPLNGTADRMMGIVAETL
jgi:hypothetical protein